MHSYLEILVIIGSLAAMMYGMLKFMLKDIHRDLIDIRKDMGELRDIQKSAEEKHIVSQKRIDHLYEICVQMLQTTHKPR